VEPCLAMGEGFCLALPETFDEKSGISVSVISHCSIILLEQSSLRFKDAKHGVAALVIFFG